MRKTLHYITILLFLGTVTLAQDNVIRVKAPLASEHQHKCWYLLVQSLNLVELETGLGLDSLEARLGSADTLANGEMRLDHLDVQTRDKNIDQARGEFVQIAYNLGKLLSDYGAELIDDLPVKEILKARDYKKRMDELAESHISEWVPKLPAVTEYAFTDGFISGIKINVQTFLREVNLEDRYTFLEKLPLTVNHIELDLEGVYDNHPAFEIAGLLHMKGIEKIKELELIGYPSLDRIQSIFGSKDISHIEKLELKGRTENIEDFIEPISRIPKLNDFPWPNTSSTLINDILLEPQNPFLIRKSVYLKLINTGHISEFSRIDIHFRDEAERIKILEVLFTEAKYLRKLGSLGFVRINFLYDQVPSDRQDLRNKLVDAYLERYPEPIKLASLVKEILKKEKSSSPYKFAKDLIKRASPERHILLTQLDALRKRKIKAAQYKEKYQEEQNKISIYPQWEKYFREKNRLDLLEHLDPVTFESVLIEIPSGGLEVQLGSFQNLANGIDQDLPVKRLLKKSYRIRKTTVSFGQYMAYVIDTGKDHHIFQKPYEHNQAVSLTFSQMLDYLKWESQITGKTLRLPTETEWEYAARGGASTEFFYGNNEMEFGYYGWHNGNSKQGDPSLLAQKIPNAFGVYDTMGNASEWTQSLYFKKYIADDKIASQLEDPIYTIRGGLRMNSISRLRLSSRGSANIDKHTYSAAFGFRVVEDVP